MRMRSHRRNLVEWSEAAAPASKSGNQRFTRFARSRRIRWWLRTGALLTFIGVMRLARITRVRWRSAFLLSGALLVVIGVMLPSLAAFLLRTAGRPLCHAERNGGKRRRVLDPVRRPVAAFLKRLVAASARLPAPTSLPVGSVSVPDHGALAGTRRSAACLAAV